MTDWQRKLTLKDIWDIEENGMTVQQLAAEMANRIRTIPPFGEGEYVETKRQDLADEFESLSEDATADKEDFNFIMADLYDWADMSLDGKWNGKKVCWIETF